MSKDDTMNLLKNLKQSNMKLYKLECLNTEGDTECNGYYLHKENAEAAAKILDSQGYYKKHRITQNIIEIETSD